MVLTRESIFGKSREVGAEKESASTHEGREMINLNKGVIAMEKKEYKVMIDNLVEKGVPHAKGRMLQVEISEERATNLIRAGYIEEVGAEEQKPEVKEPEKKNIEAPENKMITGEDTEKKTATGKGAGLLNKKKDKK